VLPSPYPYGRPFCGRGDSDPPPRRHPTTQACRGQTRPPPVARPQPAVVAVAALLLVGVTDGPAAATLPPGLAGVQFEAIDGNGNNVAHPEWGRAGTNYIRVAPARYADGRSAMVAGRNPRFISNRVFNDVNQNVFSERSISQWGNVWGQFLDHTFGLRSATGEADNIPFNASDPLESFTNDLGVIADTRSAAAPGTGVTNPREQVNTRTRSSTPRSSTATTRPGWSGCARARWTTTWPTTGRA